MNLDIVNKYTAKKTGLSEQKIILVNRFYWRSIYEHFNNYEPQPLNIEGICVFYNDKWLIKRELKRYIRKIKRIKVSRRYGENSKKRHQQLTKLGNIFKNLWQLRKKHQYTN